MRGLIQIGEKSKVVRLEQCLISNIGIEDKGSAILMNGRLNSKLELMNGVILDAIYTSGGSAINVNACEKSSTKAELVVFTQCISDVILNGK
ncbi:MAG: hypothetical protein EZS28_028427 [Streblomastix strix]|uniref:Uncharacterized protein n=1 Tax=Streblomastix strix TaxID=222440 RepID=A0A5J4UZ97_9EUKA|nr:MAG: hypothetical protein EZS28_028427 [Streblomastix strix]